MTAFIIVDMQNDFMPGGSLAVPGGDSIVPLINALQDSFMLIVATQDWHPAGHKSFASSHRGRSTFETIRLHGLEQVLWPNHCVQGSEGALFYPSLRTDRVEAIFRKGMDREIDSYSGFYDNGMKKSTGLAGYLRERNVNQVFICGVAADYCVYFTAMDALRENFKTFVIEDATRSIDPAAFERAKDTIRASGGEVITSDTLHHYL
jgi:nicotinamidase/pyrazinamidase